MATTKKDQDQNAGASGLRVKISARSPDGFRRCGRHWPHEGVVVDSAEFSDEDRARLTAERELIIEPVADEPAKESEE